MTGIGHLSPCSHTNTIGIDILDSAPCSPDKASPLDLLSCSPEQPCPLQDPLTEEAEALKVRLHLRDSPFAPTYTFFASSAETESESGEAQPPQHHHHHHHDGAAPAAVDPSQSAADPYSQFLDRPREVRSAAIETHAEYVRKVRLSLKKRALKQRIGERKERRNALSDGSGSFINFAAVAAL